MLGLKYSRDSSSPASLEHCLEAKQRGRGMGGRACGRDSKGLHCNAEELLLIHTVLINTVWRRLKANFSC